MELWDVMDADGRLTGRTMQRGSAFGDGEYHLVVHILPLDRQGRVLIQRRAETKAQLPGRWYMTAGSAVAGEGSLAAARRECREELGIAVPEQEMRFLARVKNWHSFADLYWFCCDVPAGEMQIQKEELSEVKFVTLEEFEATIFIPEYEYFFGADYRKEVRRLLTAWQDALARGELTPRL